MNRPSSTITFAFLAGQALVVLWALVDQFTTMVISPTLVAESVILVASGVGYFKKENVLPVGKP